MLWYMENGDFEAARPLAENLYRIHMDDPDASSSRRAEYTRHLGLIYVRTGRVDEGWDLIRSAIDIDPRYILPYLDLGASAGVSGLHEIASEWFVKAVTAKPSDASAHYNYAVSLRELGQMAAAKKELRAAVACVNFTPDAHKTLAAMLWQEGDFESVVEVYRDAHKLWPQDDEISHWLQQAESALEAND